MGKEIERKFLINRELLPMLSGGQELKQGYIKTINKAVVRVRLLEDEAYLTLKGKNKGASRSEFEYEIPLADAEDIISELCSKPIIEKTRYLLPYANHVWEIDVFKGDNQGLILAEVELKDEKEMVEIPPWVTEEVTADARYYNSNLLGHPYTLWK